MKRHGRYELPTVEELRLDIETGGATNEYIARQVKRQKDKYRNDKRHKLKRKSYYERRNK